MKWLCFLTAISISHSYVSAQIIVSNFNIQSYKTGLTEVEGIRFDSSGQAYIWEKAGKVWVIDTNGVKSTTPLLDITEEVGNWRDHGLNGFALDPDFRANGFFYLFYTVDRHYLMNFGTGNYNAIVNEHYNATIARVTRYTANAATNFTTTVPNSRYILIGENKKTGIPVLHESHSGGQLVFGSDGSLLISTGDGASYNLVDSGFGATYWSQALTDTIIRDKENVGSYRSQIIDCLNGKILRIDPATGNGLPTNPWYDSANPRDAKSRVWDLGLRNPFRITLKPGTGSPDITAGNPGVLYIGDVGWDNWEDMHIAAESGLNFGWPLFEGLIPTTGYVNITTVVNKDAPNPLFGGSCTTQFFRFSDLLKQANLVPSFPNPCNASQQIPSNIPHFVHTRPVITWNHNQALTQTGIYSGNNAAEISIGNSQSPINGFDFIGNASVGGAWYQGTKYPLQYQNSYFHADYAQAWIINMKFFPDNTADSVNFFAANLGPVVDIEYNPKDQWLYYIKYPADIFKIVYTTSVNNPPTAVALQNITYGAKPLLVNFTGSNSTDPENLALTYSWNFGDGTPTSNLANPAHTFNPATNNPVAFMITLTVTDNIGQSDTAKLTVYVNDTPPQVSITSFTDGDLFTMSHSTNLPLQANVFDAESPDHFLNYSWQTFLHHNNHEHPEAIDTNRITTTVLTPVGCDGNIYYYRVKLTVTDPIGLSTTVQGNLYPACNPPVPDFTANVTTGCPGLQVNFTDASANLPDSWLWSFPGGNPSTSILQNPSVIYSTGGTRNVSLTATNTHGSNSITKTGFIVVSPKPVATISPAGTDTVCSSQAVLLSANTGTNLAYQWLKNGTDIPGATSVTYNVVKAAGTYKVRVSKTTTGCSNLSAGKKIVYRAVNAIITAQGPTTFCSGDSVILSANSGPYTYQWVKGNGNISGATSLNYTAKTGGNYKVKVTDFHGCTKFSPVIALTINCKQSEKSLAIFEAAISANPVNKNAVIIFELPEAGTVNAIIYDAIGRKVSKLMENQSFNSGHNELSFDISSYSSGIYFIKISDNKESKTLKLIVNRSE